MNKFFFLFFFISSFLFSQSKIRIVDSETKQPVSDARVSYNDELSYTNDDGFVMIPDHVKNIEISAPQYSRGIYIAKSTVELKPIYNQIDEVIIRTIDAKKIIASVLKNYTENYETKTSIFNGTFKTKSEIDNKINRILVIDMDLWALNNKYDYKKEINQFMQVNLRNKKYDKNRRNDKAYIFNKKSGNREQKYIKNFLQQFFLYNQLYSMDYWTKGLKINGNVINEIGDIQTIKFKSEKTNTPDLLYYEGIMQYDKKTNAIIYLKCSQIQKNATEKYTNYFDQEIVINTNLYTVTYDMYKKNEKYIPAKITMENLSEATLENKTYPVTGYTEFVFRKHNFSNKNGLSEKIDLEKSFGDGVINNEIKDTKTLLSAEEQKFVDEP
jgi:hypothetical protein